MQRVENGSLVPEMRCIVEEEHRKLRKRLVDAGLISSIVSFLNQGVNKEFFVDEAFIVDEALRH